MNYPLARSEAIRYMKPALIASVSLVAIMILDTYTGPRLSLTVVYFLPITYTAWAMGRSAAFSVAVIGIIPNYTDQLKLMQAGEQSLFISAINILVRLLAFLFVAEVTYRLERNRKQTQLTANELATALDELQISYARQDEDIQAAGALQESVLSFEPVEVEGCEVGTVVRYAGRTGGDFADSGVIDDNTVYACIADISGKGTPAALFTTLLKHLLATSVRQGLRGNRLINLLNQSLSRALPEDRFVTLFYVEVDTDSGYAEYASAGHPDAFLYRTENADIERVSSTGPILGYTTEPYDVPIGKLKMNRGDVLVLYTDGAIESKTPEGRFLGESPLLEAIGKYASLSTREMPEAITADIESSIADDYRDDVTIVCVKKK